MKRLTVGLEQGEVSSSSLFLLYNDMTVCFHCGTVFFVDEVNPSCFTGPDVWRAMLTLTHRKRALWHVSEVAQGVTPRHPPL